VQLGDETTQVANLQSGERRRRRQVKQRRDIALVINECVAA
jgi:hypothetical protein